MRRPLRIEANTALSAHPRPDYLLQMSSPINPAEAPLHLVRQTPELAGMVDQIIGYRENGLGIDGAVEMAALVVPLIISFGEHFAIGLGGTPGADDLYGCFTSGLYAGPVVISSAGRAECIQINFTPLGAWRFFGLPMNELANQMVPLDDLGDPELIGLRQRLWDERDWNERLRIAQGFVTHRLRQSPSADPALDWAYDHLLARAGDVHITDLAGKLEWSRKHLVNRFRTRFGLPEDGAGYQGADALPEADAFFAAYRDLVPKADVGKFVDHIDHVAKRIGVDHVGVGTDFNHGAGIAGFKDESEAPNVTRELVARGYTEAQLAQIWGGNFLRALEAAQAGRA